ncbi:Hypothetical protein R9X50_00512700 [Acrodontium crateriforme]|uniref:Peptidase A1 domain-containing protein n=1 Tax=Acrodontium crateriforme TaxID=150365 RepID=A0AAQ3R5N5_9PEZI|nr:Hypothetical protein R9X50_00512700 [Acrodontium crateriforme]
MALSSSMQYIIKQSMATLRVVLQQPNADLPPSTEPARLVADQGFWFSNFTIGASKNLEILIDTGSSDAVLNPNIYQPGPKSYDTGSTFQVGYGTTNPDGSGTETATGKIYVDLIAQHGTDLSVSEQALGAISSPQSPDTFPHQGLIGYAGYSSAQLGGKPFIHSLCDQKSLKECRFGLALKTNGKGSLFYGGVKSSLFAGSLATASVIDEWLTTGDIIANGKTIQSRATIVTDSGTTVIFGPTDQVIAMFKAARMHYHLSVDGAVTGYYPCSSPPSLGFRFPAGSSGSVFNAAPAALAYAKNGNNCTAVIQGTVGFGDQWLVGQAFFQGKYIDHNIDAGTMGFANLK